MRPVLPFLAILCASQAIAATYVVKPDGTGDFPTIQAAIDAAASGDIVALTNGTFMGPGNRDVSLRGKNVTLRSQSAIADSCVIDCESTGNGIALVSGETPAARVENLTVMNGLDTTLRVVSSSPTITGCQFRHATMSWGVFLAEASPTFLDCEYDSLSGPSSGLYIYGGRASFSRCLFDHCGPTRAVETHGASPTFLDCRFLSCAELDFFSSSPRFLSCQFLSSGGLTFVTAFPTLTDCLLLRSFGPAITATQFSSVVIESCTLMACGAGVIVSDAFVSCRQSIIANSRAGFGFFVPPPSGGTPLSSSIECTDMYANSAGDWVGATAALISLNGNVATDPLFCDVATDDLTLQSNSPCLSANNSCGQMGAFGQGCGPISIHGQLVVATSWGGVKSRYR